MALFVLMFMKANQPPLTQEEVRGEQIILSYIESRQLNIRQGTDTYQKMLKGILLGEYPDLTGEGSLYATTPADRDAVITFAAGHMKAGK